MFGNLINQYKIHIFIFFGLGYLILGTGLHGDDYVEVGIAEAGHTSDLGSLVPRLQEPWAAMQAPDSQFAGDLRSRAHFRSWQPCAPTPGALGHSSTP